MLTPQRIQELADPIESIYISMTNELLVNIGRHVTSPTWTHTAAWEIQKLSELGQLTQENAAIINRWAKSIPEEVRETMEETRREALASIEKQMEQAAKDGYLTPPMRDSTYDVLRDYTQQAEDKLNLVNTTMLQSSVQQYSRLVQLTAELERQAENTQRILNEAAGSVALGTETRTQALNRAIKQISEEGLTGFYDRAGRSWSPEAYVNMDIRTTVHNVAIESVKNRMADYNTYVFQISSHAGARPRCYPFQGGFYSWDNTHGEIELGDGTTESYEPINDTSYGEAAGIFGINCGHFPIPIIPGVSIPHGADNIQPKELNDKTYKESQQQRALERNIRAAKRAIEMGDTSKEAKQAVKDAQARMRQFIAETGRTRRYDREKLYGGTKAPTLPKDQRQTPEPTQKVNSQSTKDNAKADKIQIPAFTPAKTQKEAEEFAKNFANNVSYKGISLDNCNQVNDTLNTLTTKYPIRKFDELKQNGRQKSVARANFSTIEINGKKIGKEESDAFEMNLAYYRASIQAIKSRYPDGRIPPDMQKQIDRYEYKLKYNRWSVAGKYGVSGTITHEYGHVIADQYWGMINGGYATPGFNDPATREKKLLMAQKLDSVFKEAKSNGDIFNLSQYGATDKDEFFAEAFCAREHGEKLPDYIENVVEEICNGASLR